ncbi:type VI secretion system Vgr family protein [Paraburkholderia xenovorans]|uniref:type VI secretion system Vgr family protein n=1 Tax=Paraburkholderia xenovorans TaxID=36873 RepID=UPI0038BA0492
MYKPSQLRTLSVSCEAFPIDRGVPVLSPVRLRGTEALGKLYRYTLDMATTYTPGLSQYNTRFQIVPAKLVGKEITISIEFDGKGVFIPGMPGDSGAGNVGAGVRTITGIIARVEMTGVDDRHTYYRLVVRPALWLTTKTSRSRIFQNRSVLDITRDVLREHPVLFDVKVSAHGLKGGYPERDFVRQMWESDFHFLTRLWREWGIYYFQDNNRLVLCDGPGVHEPHRNAYDSIRYHAREGGRIDEEHIHKLKASRRVTAARVTVVDYDYTRGAQKFVEEHDAFGELHKAEERHWGDYSQPLAGATGLSGRPNNYQEEAYYLAGVRAHALYSRNERLRGRGNLLGLKTGRTFFLTDHPESDVNAEYLVVSTTLDIRNVSETTISGKTPGAGQYQCVTDFVLQSPNRFFRNRPKKKPRCYAETAVVVGPKDQTTWVDAYGRVKICYLWDVDRPKDENASCWVRVSSPWQGNSFGSIYVPRIGQEVTINYHEGDPDKPYIADRMVNRFRQPPWLLPANYALSGTRTQELKGFQANQIVADDTPGKLQVQVSSDYAQSRLIVGYNTRIDGNKGRKEARGEGWELATDAWGVARANKGLLVTTETRSGATAPVKDMGETVQRLTQARELHEDMADVARQHHAQQDGADQRDAIGNIKAQNDAIRGNAITDGNPFPELARPDMVLASAAGIGMTAAQSTHLASSYDLAVTTGRDVSIASGRSLFAAVRGAVSLFAYQLGMRLIAAKGKVEIQAQSDQIALTALKDVTITSTDGRVVITAAKEVWIGAGGSYIQINGSGIINASPGPILEKTASWDVPGPDARIPVFAPFGSGTPTDGYTHSL